MTNSKVNHFLVNAQVPTRKVHGHEFPYYKVLMDNGTPCDLLANKPRTTSVLYMCNPRSSNEVRLLSSPRRRYNVTSVGKCLGSCPDILFLGQSWHVLKSWYTGLGGGEEQGFWYSFTNRLNQSLVSSVVQASL